MALITGPLKWYTVAETVRSAIMADLTTLPDRSAVVPGAIAWDECDCGLLAVSVARIYLSDNFPQPLTEKVGVAACDAAWDVGEFVVQLIRCAPNPEGDALAPTVAALDASAQEILRDAYELLQSVTVTLCEMKEQPDREIIDFFVNPLTSQGPSGGCVGSEVRFLVALARN
jgi:hypothetical protein